MIGRAVIIHAIRDDGVSSMKGRGGEGEGEGEREKEDRRRGRREGRGAEKQNTYLCLLFFFLFFTTAIFGTRIAQGVIGISNSTDLFTIPDDIDFSDSPACIPYVKTASLFLPPLPSPLSFPPLSFFSNPILCSSVTNKHTGIGVAHLVGGSFDPTIDGFVYFVTLVFLSPPFYLFFYICFLIIFFCSYWFIYLFL